MCRRDVTRAIPRLSLAEFMVDEGVIPGRARCIPEGFWKDDPVGGQIERSPDPD